MTIREKGISPPPKPDLGFEDLQKAKLTNFQSYMKDLDKWLRRLSAVFPLVQTSELTIDPGSVLANTSAEQAFTVNGLRTEDVVMVTKPTLTPGFGIAGARVSADNTLAITFINTTVGAIDPGPETYFVAAIRR